VRELGLNGQVVRELRDGLEGRPLVEGFFSAEVRRQSGGRAEPTPAILDMMRAMTPHKSLPVISHLLCTRDGSMWVGLYPAPDARMRVVLRFDSTFALQGQIELERDAVLLDADRDVLLLARPDADDIAVVKRRRIVTRR